MHTCRDPRVCIEYSYTCMHAKLYILHKEISAASHVSQFPSCVHSSYGRACLLPCSQLPCMKEAICDVQEVVSSLQGRRAAAEAEVRRCFDSLHQLLDQRQTVLINALNTIESEKQQTLGKECQPFFCFSLLTSSPVHIYSFLMTSESWNFKKNYLIVINKNNSAISFHPGN